MHKLLIQNVFQRYCRVRSTLFVQFVTLRGFIYEEIIEEVNKSASRLYVYAPKVE
jgi:hypothetical protein